MYIIGLRFYDKFSPALAPIHNKTLHHLSTLLLPSHVGHDDLAQRFRREKYVLRMSRTGFNLLVGWLTEGMGGEAMGAGDGFSGDKGKRGRAAVMRVVNNHLRFDGKLIHSPSKRLLIVFEVTSSSSASIPSHSWEESTGLLSSLIPGSRNGQSASTNPAAFNASKGPLKLGPAPIDDALRQEAERVLREEIASGVERDVDFQGFRPSVPAGLISPETSDLLPYPPLFKSIDVRREVEKMRDARKRVKLEPSAMLLDKDMNDSQAAAARARALPSICAYTLHDVGDGYVLNVI